MKQTKRKLFAVVVLSLLLSSTAWAAGLSTFGVGARAKSMGGAFRAIADDWSAAYWNPAGLAYLESSELDLTLLFVNQRPAYTPTQSEGLLIDGFNIKSGGERYPDDVILPFPTFSGFFALPTAGGLTLGAAIYWTQDVNMSWDLYQPPTGYNPRSSLPDDNYRLDLDVWDFHPTLSKELIKDKLSAGIGLSIQRGDIVFHRIHQWLVPQQNLEYYRFIGNMRFNGNGTGYGGNAGILYKYNDKLTFGLSGQTPVTIELSGSTALSVILPRNDVIWEDEQAILQSGTKEAAAPFTMDLKLPGSIGLGVAYHVDDRWTLAADFAINFWSEMEGWEFKIQGSPLELFEGLEPVSELAMPMDGEDQMQFSLGTEYKMQEDLVLRGGYSFDQSAFPDRTRRPYLPDYGSLHSLQAGASFFLKSFEFSGMVRGAFSGTTTVEEITDLNEDGQFDNFPGEYKTSQFDFLISTIYRF